MRVCVLLTITLCYWQYGSLSLAPCLVKWRSLVQISCPVPPLLGAKTYSLKKKNLAWVGCYPLQFLFLWCLMFSVACIPFGCKRVTSMEISCHEISFIVIISITFIFLFNFHLLIYWILVERWIKKLCMLFVEIWDKYFSLRLIL